MAKEDAGKQVASAKTYRFGGRVSVEGMTIAQLSEERCQTDIFNISPDERTTKAGGARDWARAGQRIIYSQRELLANEASYLEKIPRRYQFLPEAGDQIVAPETALYCLTYNTRNRTVSDSRVLKFAQDMVSGAWLNAGDPVYFCLPEGEKTPWIISGQARLWASWLTNIPCEHTVRWGTNPDVQGIIDTGKTRTVTDLFSSLNKPRYRILPGASSLVRGYEEHEPRFHGAMTWETIPRYPSNDTLDWVNANPQFEERVDSTFDSLKICRRLLQTPVLPSGLEYLLYLHSDDAKACKRFWEDLETGVGLAQNDPVMVLREMLVRDTTYLQKRLNRLTIAALVIKAWNLRQRGRTIKDLRWRTTAANLEPFPEIL